MKYARIDNFAAVEPEIPADHRVDRLGHDAAMPERLAEPVADGGALLVGVEPDLTDIAGPGQFDAESHLLGRWRGGCRVKPAFRVAERIGIGHAGEVASHGEVVEVTRDGAGIGGAGLAQQQAAGGQ